MSETYRPVKPHFIPTTFYQKVPIHTHTLAYYKQLSFHNHKLKGMKLALPKQAQNFEVTLHFLMITFSFPPPASPFSSFSVPFLPPLPLAEPFSLPSLPASLAFLPLLFCP